MSAKRPRLTCALLLKQADHTLPGWLAWHLSLGIEHIAIIDGGIDDSARQIIRSLQPDWPVSWLPVELPDDLTAEARRLTLTRRAVTHLRHITQGMKQLSREENGHDDPVDDWIIILDADEYLTVERGAQTLFHRTPDGTSAIAIHWRIHGTAGHLSPPPGHIVANHTWHAPPSFPDHQFVRLLARLDSLPAAEELTDPLMFGLPAEKIRRINGQPYHPNDETVLTSLWEGGCIQHYICALAHGKKELPPPMRAHYDRNEQMTAQGTHQLREMRKLANQMREAALQAGLSRLKKLAAQRLDEYRKKQREQDANIAIADHVQHDTFHYDRILPPADSTLLLNLQFSPPYVTGQSVLLRFTEGRLLECDQTEQRQPFIGFWQEANPHILTLHTQDRAPFTLGDAPCPFGMTSLRITFDAEKRQVHLPYETGHSSTPLEIIPASVPPTILFVPLPPADEPGGLSVHGLLMWLAGHPNVKPHDLQRALLLLSPASAHQMRMLAPALEEFLPNFQTRPAFMP